MKEHVSKIRGKISTEEVYNIVLLRNITHPGASSINYLRNNCTLKPNDLTLTCLIVWEGRIAGVGGDKGKTS